jgi:hypothetical protein
MVYNLNNRQKTNFDTVGIIVRAAPGRIKEILDYIQSTPDMFLVFHKTSKMKLILVEKPFGEEGNRGNFL